MSQCHSVTVSLPMFKLFFASNIIVLLIQSIIASSTSSHWNKLVIPPGILWRISMEAPIHVPVVAISFLVLGTASFHIRTAALLIRPVSLMNDSKAVVFVLDQCCWRRRIPGMVIQDSRISSFKNHFILCNRVDGLVGLVGEGLCRNIVKSEDLLGRPKWSSVPSNVTVERVEKEEVGFRMGELEREVLSKDGIHGMFPLSIRNNRNGEPPSSFSSFLRAFWSNGLQKNITMTRHWNLVVR